MSSSSLKLIVALAVVAVCHAQGSQFRSPSKPKDIDDDISSEAASPVHYRLRPGAQQQQYEYSDEEEDAPSAAPPQQTYNRPAPRQQITNHIQPQAQAKSRLISTKKQQYEEELADEIEEPDRLQIMLQKSQFQCHDRITGYYADDTVGCEVFHYCQDNAKHSWVCPEGFTFHQVHLICMPPSSENICEQSSKYHVVNEYLYKPINMEEHQRKPNVSIKYAERYFPGEIYYDDRRDYYEDRQPVRIVATPSPAPRKQPTQGPFHVTTAAPYRQQNAYRSPEDINISLQQRRPTQQPPRYEEEEYDSYEK